MGSKLRFSIFLFFITPYFATSSHILIIPCSLTKSHNYFYSRLGCLLQDRSGHQVSIFNPLFNPTLNGPIIFPCNITGMDVQFNGSYSDDNSDIVSKTAYAKWIYSMKSNQDDAVDIFKLLAQNRASSSRESVNRIAEFYDACSDRGQCKFDLALVASCTYYPLAVTRFLLNVPTIYINAQNVLYEDQQSLLGLENKLAYDTSFYGVRSDRKSFSERFADVRQYVVKKWWDMTFQPVSSVLAAEIEPFRTDPKDKTVTIDKFLGEIQRVPLAITYAETMLEFPRQQAHNIFSLGMLRGEAGNEHITAKEGLKRWHQLLSRIDVSNGGIVLLNFGTIAHTDYMPIAMKQALAGGLGHLAATSNYTIVWKVDTIETFNSVLPSPLPDNFIVAKWVPQSLLLDSGKTKVFISHCGYNSMMEGCYAGVPFLVIPLFVDQASNAKRLERLGVAKWISKTELNSQRLYDVIIDVIEKLPSRSSKLAKMLSDPLRTNEDLYLFHINRAIRLGNKIPRLSEATRKLGLIQFYCIDVVLSLIITVVVFMKLIICFLRWILLLCC